MTQDLTKNLPFQMTDQQLVSHLGDLIISEREQLVMQLEILQVMDARKLFFQCSSLWAYLTQERGVDENTALRRIRAARVMKKYPELKGLLESGKMNLGLLEIALSCSYREGLSDSELGEVIRSISGMTCKKAKRTIANQYPESVDIPRDRLRPIHDGYTEVTFYANAELMNRLEEIQGLLAGSQSGIQMRQVINVLANNFYDRNHPVPQAKRAQEREEKRERKNQKAGESMDESFQSEETPSTLMGETEKNQPEPDTSAETFPDIVVERRIHSQAIVHALVRRDGYVCGYIDPKTGLKCQSSYSLEKHHLRSWASGGDTSLNNTIYLCKSHHARISFLEFGKASQYFKKRSK